MKRRMVVLVLFGAALCLLIGLTAWAKMPKGTQRNYGPIGLAPVPATGQTTSYYSGDDGALEMGVTYAGPERFTDNGDGTVTDNLTGLVWTKNANLGQMSWADACDECQDLEFAGFDDWRLPNLRELHSLIDYGEFEPALPSGHPFDNVQSSYYWSSTTNADNTDAAWVFFYFDVGGVNHSGKSADLYVWCVRGGR